MPSADVDVVLCTHNGARFVEAQLRSLAEQTVAIGRLLVSDDASTDGTLDIVASYADRLPIEISHNPAALGSVRNFESALPRARGRLIFLCDQDDVWRADKVAKFVTAAAADSRPLLYYSDARLADATRAVAGGVLSAKVGWPPTSADESGDFVSLLRRNFITGATVAIRRELVELALPIPDGFWHDEWLALVAAALGPIKRIEEPLIDYRIHSGNQAGLLKVGRRAQLRAMTSSRGDFHAEKARKLAVLRERLLSLGDRVGRDRLEAVTDACEHWQRRATLAPAHWKRLAVVAGELASGRYRLYSSGLRSAIRDLFEPLG